VTAENNKAINEAQIRALRDDLANALRAKDADGVTSHYAADIAMFVFATSLQHTIGDNASPKMGIEEWFSSFQGSIGYEIRDLNITTGDDVAFCHSLNRISGTRSDGGKVEMWVREALCFCKIGGKWKITHQQQFVPSKL
jgi:ketosteroid isomerase-like protein